MKRLFFSICSVLLAGTVCAQTSIVGGTTFEQKEGYSDWGWDFSTVQQIGPAGNTLAGGLDYIEDGNSIQEGGHWVCVDNPFKLGTNEEDETSLYADIDDDMFVTNLTGTACTKLFSYTVNGLKPGSAYRVTMRVHILQNDAPSMGYYGSLTAGVNLNQWMQGGDGGVAKTVDGLTTGGYKDVEFTGTLTSSQTSMVVSIMEGYNMSSNVLVGISDLVVYGTINPKILSGQGTEMCRGEQTLLTLDRDYGSDATIVWEKSPSGQSWTEVSTKASLYDEVTATTMNYRATVNGITTDPLEVTTVTCCETVVDGKTVYSSRETIFYEDFGHFTDEHTYVDAEGNVSTTPSTWYPYRADVNFDLPSTAGSYDYAGQINDGNYGVVVPTGIGYCTDASCNSTATWMTGNGAITSDHSSLISGVPNSACLFMNVNFNFTGTVFSRTISDLCTGKALSFEMYAGNMSAGEDPVITLNIKDKSGNVLASKENVRVGVGTGWNRISIDDLILTESDIVVEIQSWGTNWNNGQDLCIDDIKIMACSSPALDLFSDVENFQRVTPVCSDPFTLGSVASDLLKAYYGSTLQYLFQYSLTPDDESSWVDIVKSSESTYTISSPKESQIFDGVPSGQSVYFRVVAATASTLNSTHTFSQTNYCKNYSISPSVEAVVDCPTCSVPKKVTIDGDDELCPGSSTTLEVTEQDDATSFSYTWYKGSIADENIVKTQTAATLPLTVDYSDADIYYVVVKDVAFPTLTSCQQTAEYEVTALENPTYTISGGETICEGSEITNPVVFTLTGSRNTFTMTYSDGTNTYTDVAVKSSATYSPEMPSTEGTYTYTISSLVDRKGCIAEITNQSATIQINPVPTVTLDADKNEVCEGDETIKLTASASEGSTIVWKKGTSVLSNTSATMTLSTAGESGTYSVQATADGCSSSVAEQTVTINEKPEITSLVADVSAVCSGETITLTATVSDDGSGTFTWSGDDALVANGATATLSKDVTTDTDVTVTLAYANGCDAKETKTIPLTFYAIPSAPQVQSPITYCVTTPQSDVKSLTEAIITSAAGAELTWYKEGTSISENELIPSIATATDVTYSVTQTLHSCVSDPAEIIVSVSDELTPVITLGNSSLCYGTETTVSLGSSVEYAKVEWSGTGKEYLKTTTEASTVFKGTAPASNTSYELTVLVEDEQGCTGTSTTSITVNPIPEVTLSSLENACADVDATQTITATEASGIAGTGSWSSNVESPANMTASFTPKTAGAGTYTITYDFESDDHCKANQATTSVTVYDMPTVTVAPSAETACLAGATKTDVVKMAPTVTYETNTTNATFTYSSSTLTLNADGSFDPKSASQGVHAIDLLYTDGNSCTATASTTVTINPQPISDISDNQSSICDYAEAITLSAKVDGVATSEGTFGGSYVSGFTFTPEVLTATKTVTLTYNYVDATTGCTADEVTTDITVAHVDKPIALDAASSKLEVTSAATVPALSATGTDITWYDNASATGTGTKAATYTVAYVDDGGYMKPGEYVMYATQSIDGCESDPVAVTLTITDCAAKAPTAKTYHACVAGDSDIEITATTNLLSENNFAWYRDKADIPNHTVASLSDAGADATGATYSISKSELTEDKTITVYVAEYYEVDQCFSAGTPVNIIVHALPEPEITDPGMICSTTPSVEIRYTPTDGSTLTGDGIGTDGKTWTPQYTSSATGVSETILTVTTEKVWGTGATEVSATCENTATRTVSVTHVLAPTGTGIDSEVTHGEAGLATIPAMEITYADDLGASLSVSDATGSVIATASPVDMTSLISKAGTYTYDVQQTLHGCKSDIVQSIYNIVKCPTPAPVVADVEICEGDALPTITATGDGTITWLSESGTQIGTGATLDVSSLSGYESKEGSYTFRLYQEGDDAAGGTCVGPESQMTLTILSLPTISFDKSSEIVCYTKSEVVIDVTVEAKNGTGSGSWSMEDGDASAISQDGVFYPQVNGTIEGQSQYTIVYDYVDAKSCKNQATRTIDVIYLDAPETFGFFAMSNQTDPVVISATTTVGDAIHWFTTATAIKDPKSESELWYTGDANNVALPAKTYYARQYSQGCYSESSPAVVEIVDCPIPNVVISSAEACLYDGAPTLTANGGEWAERPAGSEYRFYSDAEATSLLESSTDGTYTPTNISAKGSYEYYVTEYNANIQPFVTVYNVDTKFACEGKPVKVTVTMKETPPATITYDQSEVCLEEQSPKFMATQYTGDLYWYMDDPGIEGVPTATSKGSGASYIPEKSNVGEHYVWAVVYADGCYSSREPVSFVVNPIPESPSVTNAEVCYGDDAASLTATGVTGSVITWYSDMVKSNKVATGVSTYTPTVYDARSYSYYVSQKIAGCESPLSEVTYTVKALPVAPVILAQDKICDYDESPVLIASGENITWYAKDQTTKLAEGDTYEATDMTVGTQRYYATQTVDGCEGYFGVVQYQIVAKPEQPTTIGASVCEGSEEIPSLSTNIASDSWYAGDKLTLLGTGFQYTPNASEVGNNDITYYVLRERNGCASDFEPVVLHVIQKPSMTIGNDTTVCIYDDVLTIKADNFEPPITNLSYIDWKVTSATTSRKYLDTENHEITPANMLNEPGTYTISAIYTYKYDAVTCQSDEIEMKYRIVDRARTPIVFSTVICQGNNIDDLQALGSQNIVWESLSGTQPTRWVGPKYKFQDGQALDTGVYYFKIYDVNIFDADAYAQGNGGACMSIVDTVSMTVAPSAMTQLFRGEDGVSVELDSVCVGESGVSYYTQYTEGSTYYWTLTGDHLNYSKDANSTSVHYVDWLKAGIDTLVVYERTWAGCEGFDTLYVKIAPAPVPMYTWTMPGSTNIIEFTDSTYQDSLWYTNADGDLVAEPITYTMLWNYGHQGELETEIDTIIPYDQRKYSFQEGDYIFGFNCPILQVENSFGCVAKYTECIFVNLTSSLFVPDAFSPTNPAHSVRTFAPKGYNLKSCKISVYDKWGNLLWFSDEVEDGMFVGSWDGTYEGKMMKSDIYIWKMEATFLDGQVWEGFDIGNGKKTKFGNVTLIR